MTAHPGIKLAVMWSDQRSLIGVTRARASITIVPKCATTSDHY
jgi:hypothetical protein